MLVVTECDVFWFTNQLYTMCKDRHMTPPPMFMSIADYLQSHNGKRGIVFDTQYNASLVSPEPYFALKFGAIDIDPMIDYIGNRKKTKIADFTMNKSNLVAETIAQAENNDSHSLSAMLSNFTPSVRPKVKQHIVAFLTSTKKANFSLPPELQPKRGRAVQYYQTAAKTNFRSLKADVKRESPETYEARYWQRVIMASSKH